MRRVKKNNFSHYKRKILQPLFGAETTESQKLMFSREHGLIEENCLPVIQWELTEFELSYSPLQIAIWASTVHLVWFYGDKATGG